PWANAANFRLRRGSRCGTHPDRTLREPGQTSRIARQHDNRPFWEFLQRSLCGKNAAGQTTDIPSNSASKPNRRGNPGSEPYTGQFWFEACSQPARRNELSSDFGEREDLRSCEEHSGIPVRVEAIQPSGSRLRSAVRAVVD